MSAPIHISNVSIDVSYKRKIKNKEINSYIQLCFCLFFRCGGRGEALVRIRFLSHVFFFVNLSQRIHFRAIPQRLSAIEWAQRDARGRADSDGTRSGNNNKKKKENERNEKEGSKKPRRKRLKGTDSWGGNWAAINRSASRARLGRKSPRYYNLLPTNEKKEENTQMCVPFISSSSPEVTVSERK